MRCFVALDISPEVHSALTEVIAQMKKLSHAPRWVRPEGLHITLKFIGEVGEERAKQIETVLSPIRLPRPVEVRLQGFGLFPSERRPRVLWTAMEASPNLAELAAAVDHALEGAGVPRETRPFVPHLTLARFSSLQDVDKLNHALKQNANLDFGTVKTSDFHLYRSVLKPSGAEYTRLRTFRFAEGAA